MKIKLSKHFLAAASTTVLAARAAKEYVPDIRRFLLSAVRHPVCKIDPWPDTPTDILIFAFAETPYGTIRYEMIPRSVSSIFQFLGGILAAHREEAFRTRRRLSPVEDTRILAIERETFWEYVANYFKGHCIFAASLGTEYYCVPKQGAENTKRILDVLAYLVGMNS